LGRLAPSPFPAEGRRRRARCACNGPTTRAPASAGGWSALGAGRRHAGGRARRAWGGSGESLGAGGGEMGATASLRPRAAAVGVPGRLATQGRRWDGAWSDGMACESGRLGSRARSTVPLGAAARSWRWTTARAAASRGQDVFFMAAVRGAFGNRQQAAAGVDIYYFSGNCKGVGARPPAAALGTTWAKPATSTKEANNNEARRSAAGLCGA